MSKRIAAFELWVNGKKSRDNSNYRSREIGTSSRRHASYMTSEVGKLVIVGQSQHTPTCIMRRGNRRQGQPGQTNKDVDVEHNEVARIGLSGCSKEDTGQELSAATHHVRPSNGWKPTTTT